MGRVPFSVLCIAGVLACVALLQPAASGARGEGPRSITVYTSGMIADWPRCDAHRCGPAPRIPNWSCPDGRSRGGRGPCVQLPDGRCGWVRLECPEESVDEDPEPSPPPAPAQTTRAPLRCVPNRAIAPPPSADKIGIYAPSNTDQRPALPGRTVGVLIAPGHYRWGSMHVAGYPWQWPSGAEQTAPRLHVGEHGVFIGYFLREPVPAGRRFKLYVYTSSGERTFFEIPSGFHYAREATAAMGVREPVHLVELDVNRGHGSAQVAAASTILATNVVVRDGTELFPHPLVDWLTAARACFDATVSRHAQGLRRQLKRAESQLDAHWQGRIIGVTPGTRRGVLVRPHWNAERRRMEVLFAYKETANKTVRTKPSHRNEKGPPVPPELSVRYATAMAARFVSDGNVIREVALYGPMVTEPGFGDHATPWIHAPPTWVDGGR